jgi:hypothetical protein
MKEILQNIVTNTFDLGCFELVRVYGTEEETIINGLAGDRSVIVEGRLAEPVSELIGIFGMPNMATLKTILGINEYDTDSKITVKTGKNGPENLHFENAAGDFQNDYRFMVKDIVNELLEKVKFKGAEWAIELVPNVAAIQRLKFQAMANNTEDTFQMKTVEKDLIFTFGDHSTHAGNFIFEHDVNGSLTVNDWFWPVQNIINILSLTGDKSMRISNDGATEITVDSGLAKYTYVFPAQTK